MTGFVNAFEDYDNGLLVFLYRSEDGSLRKRSVEAPYTAFVETERVDPGTRSALFRACGPGMPIRRIIDQGRFTRIDWRTNNDRKAAVQGGGPFMQRGIPTFEGDVSALRRYMSEHEVPIATPSRGYVDIETDARFSFDRKIECRILCWTLINEDESVVETGMLEYDNDEAEKKLLDAFWKAAEKYDQLVGWNAQSFDFPMLQERANIVGLQVKFRRWLYLDQLVLFRRMNTASESGEEKQSFKLNDIAQAILGEAKDEFDSKKTFEAWSKGGEERARLLRYNKKDTLLLARLERKTGYIKLFQTLCEVCHGFCDTWFLNPTKQLDGYMLKLGAQRGLHFPTKLFDDDNKKEDDDPYAGAYVMHPDVKAGILKNVHVCDFASLYPSIILTWNMSPETKEVLNGQSYCKSPSTGVRFDNIEGAILPTALSELIRLRKEWNERKSNAAPGTPEWYDADRRSTAYKVAANSFYGVVGSTFSRYYDRQIAESVTQNGQWLIKKTIEEAVKRGWRAVYGDTDSVFLTGCTKGEFEDFTRWCNETFYPRILKECGCTRNHVKLAYEKQFDWLVFTAAKRYVGTYLHYKGKAATIDSKPEVKGLEYKRGDTLLMARRLQEDVIKLFCGKCDDLTMYLKLVERCAYRVLNEQLPVDEVKVSKGISKPLNEYPSESLPHIRIAKLLLERGEQIGKGTKVQYIVTDASTSPMKVIPADDWVGECDRFYLWESLVYPPTYRLLAAIFPNHEVDLDKYKKVRPKKTRGESKRVSLEQQGQVSMFPEITSCNRPATIDLSGVLLAPPQSSKNKPFVLQLEEHHTKVMGRIREALKSHPGSRPVVLECKLKSALVVMDLPITVAVTPALKLTIDEILNGVNHAKTK